MTSTAPPLLADIAIDDPSQDRLERTPFAKSLARSLLGLQGEDSFVFGLCGPWGSGKTSVLNLILKELEAVEESQRPIIFRFNPWWFSGRHQLLESFLTQFGATLSIAEKGKKAGKAAILLQQLSSGLRPLSYLPVVGAAAKAGSEIAGKLGDAAKMYSDAMKKDVFQVRTTIDEALQELDRRIVVVMDDIDRLSAEEIAEIFLILKAVADFPRTVYLLAFDGRVVRRAIRQKLGVNGKTYLEKIVQLQIELPSVGHSAVHELFLEQLSGLLGDQQVSEGDKQEFGNLFYDGVKHFLTTPRASKKLLNTLRFAYPPLQGEVYFPDLVGIATLFTFVPAAVQFLAEDPERFTGIDRSSEDRKELKAFHEQWLRTIDAKSRPHVEGILKRVFPKFHWAFDGPGYSADFESIWAKELRACSSRHFAKYILFSVPKGAVSEAEWTSLLALLDDPATFQKRVVDAITERGRHVGLSKGKEFLDRLGDLAAHSTDSTRIKKLFKSVLRIGDSLVAVRDEEVYGFLNNERRVRRILYLSLAHLQKPKERLDLLREGLDGEFGLLTLTELADSLAREHGMFGSKKPDPTDEPLLREPAVQGLLKQVTAKIREAAKGDDDSPLAQHPFCLRIVRNWCDFGSQDAALRWFRKQTKRDEFLIQQLRQTASKVRSHGMSDRVVRQDVTVDTSYLGRFFNLKQLKTRCRQLLKDDDGGRLSEADRRILQITDALITEKGKPVNDRDRRRAQAMAENEED